MFYTSLSKMKNLQAAWHHVRKSAKTSANSDIKSAAEEFDDNSFSKLRSIQGRLLRGTYRFPKSHGILKDKKKREAAGKDPRPIVISAIEARVVQRAILDALQSPENHALYQHLGKIRDVNASPFSVGGIPNGGVPIGIKKVLEALKQGYPYFFKSDIAGFFTKIRHAPVARFIQDETNDAQLTQLFADALDIELENKERLGDYFDLFPHDGIGVAQGSSLSALAGNILLHDFDHLINTPDTRAYRYIDDVIILGRTNEAVSGAKNLAIKVLRKFGMSFYAPSTDRTKADEGHARDGFVFLGCSIHGQRVSPARTSINKALDKIDREIKSTKNTIDRLLSGSDGRNCEVAYAQSLVRIDNSLRSWAKSYSFVTDRLPFNQMDKQIDSKLESYRLWFGHKAKQLTPQQRRRAVGVYLLADTILAPPSLVSKRMRLRSPPRNQQPTRAQTNRLVEQNY